MLVVCKSPPLIEVLVETATPVVEFPVFSLTLVKLTVPVAMVFAKVKPVAEELVFVAV